MSDELLLAALQRIEKKLDDLQRLLKNVDEDVKRIKSRQKQ
jgi:hypothetical protein